MPIAPTRWLVGLHRRFTSKTAVHRLRLGPASCGERRARGSATASEDDAAHRQSECNRARAMLRGASDDRVRLHCALGGQESRTSVASSILFNTTRRARAFGHKHAPIATGYTEAPTRRIRHDGEMENCLRVLSSYGVDDLMCTAGGGLGGTETLGPRRVGRAHDFSGALLQCRRASTPVS